ncbi:hypothetical protein WME89_11800 [Sorangium sp. So ce321]|uniref:hypothetical protein n=1 Tax=Sorangium sp. So ce321 TaxID=3133300 RepID=UPI003F63FF56
MTWLSYVLDRHPELERKLRAENEAQVLLAVLLRRLRMRRAPGHPVSPQAAATLRPRRGLERTLHPA